MVRRLTRRSFGPDFVDEHDARVEIALLAGQPLVDRIRDDVADAPPIVRRRWNIAGRPAAGRQTHPTSRNSARSRPSPWRATRPVTRACALMARQSGKRGTCVGIGDLLDERRRIDRREQARALEIVGDDAGDIAPDLAVGGAADKIRQRDRQRLDVALRDVDAQNRRCRRGRKPMPRRPPRRRRATSSRRRLESCLDILE